MNVISIITDSIAMPRVDGPDNLQIHKTWPKLLCSKLHPGLYSLAEFSGRLRDSSILRSDIMFYEAIACCTPKIIVIQLGIVDCAPRIFTQMEKRNLNRFFTPKFIKDYIINKRSANRRKILLRAGPLSKVSTKPGKYKENFEFFFNRLRSAHQSTFVVLLPIIGDLRLLEEKSPGYIRNINMYNQILSEFKSDKTFFLSDLSSRLNDSQFYCSDSYHVNEEGNEVIAKTIFDFVQTIT